MTHADDLQFYIGTFTGGQGIHLASLNTDSGALTPPILTVEEDDPNFLTLSRDGQVLYTTSHRTGDSVAAYQITGDGLQALNRQPSGGGAPCHVALHPSGRFLAVANYIGGSASIYPIDADGSIGLAVTLVQHTGTGPHPRRQEAPHAHSANFSPDGTRLYVADLGIDSIMIYRVHPETGALTANDPPRAMLHPGAGPRHLSFHPNGPFVYVINELDGTVTLFHHDPASGALVKQQTVSTVPDDVEGRVSCAEVKVHPNGRFLYASTRGHDSIAVFEIDSETGRLTLVEIFTDGINEPRHFNIDPTGRFCVVANQHANTVTSYRIDADTGRLQATGHSISVEKPVCIQFRYCGPPRTFRDLTRDALPT